MCAIDEDGRGLWLPWLRLWLPGTWTTTARAATPATDPGKARPLEHSMVLLAMIFRPLESYPGVLADQVDSLMDQSPLVISVTWASCKHQLIEWFHTTGFCATKRCLLRHARQGWRKNAITLRLHAPRQLWKLLAAYPGCHVRSGAIVVVDPF